MPRQRSPGKLFRLLIAFWTLWNSPDQGFLFLEAFWCKLGVWYSHLHLSEATSQKKLLQISRWLTPFLYHNSSSTTISSAVSKMFDFCFNKRTNEHPLKSSTRVPDYIDTPIKTSRKCPSTIENTHSIELPTFSVKCFRWSMDSFRFLQEIWFTLGDRLDRLISTNSHYISLTSLNTIFRHVTKFLTSAGLGSLYGFL